MNTVSTIPGSYYNRAFEIVANSKKDEPRSLSFMNEVLTNRNAMADMLAILN